MNKQTTIENMGDGWPFPERGLDDYAERRANWREVDPKHWDYFLGVLPPRLQFKNGFLVGEPASDDERGHPTYSAFVMMRGRCFTRDMAYDRVGRYLIELDELLNKLEKEPR